MSVNLYTEDGLKRIAGNGGGGNTEEVQNKLLELEEKIKQLESANEETNQKVDSITKESLGLGNVDNTHDKDKIVRSGMIFYVNAIQADTDLNDIRTPGLYRCSVNSVVATLKNCPVTHAFSMVVLLGGGTYQELTEYMPTNPKKYFRNIYDYSGEVGRWYRIYTEADPQTK